MGIINLTDDSFYKGSRVATEQALVARATQLHLQGAAIIDIGAFSTRPGASAITEEVELQRVSQGMALLAAELPQCLFSVDTFRASVAEAAISSGAHMINDVSGGSFDKDMYTTVRRLQVPYVLTHNRGSFQSMHQAQQYGDILDEIALEISQKLQVMRSLGICDILLDPGFGFAKNSDQNYALLHRLRELHIFDCPILVGISRKGMIWKTLGITPEQALNGTTALHMLALEQGVSVLRVHDVPQALETIALWQAYHKNEPHGERF